MASHADADDPGRSLVRDGPVDAADADAGAADSRTADARETSAAQARARYAVGLVLLLLVVVIWVAAAELMEFVFKEEEFSKPFFVTYLSTSTFAVHLVIVAGRALVLRCRRPPTAVAPRHATDEEDDRPLLLDDDDAFALGGDDDDDDQERDNVFGDRNGRRSDSDRDRGVDGTSPAGIQLDALPAKPHTATTIKPPTVAASTSLEPPRTPPTSASTPEATHFTLRQFCFLWFLANVFSNASLQHTTVTSSTILSSTSGFFTLILGVLLRVEAVSITKFFVVLVSMAGVALVSVSDSRQPSTLPGDDTQMLLGDLLALGGAFMYGVYTTLLKKKIGHEDRIDMRLFFGFVGVFNVLLLWPGFLLLHYTGLEPFELPSSRVLALLILNAVIGTFVSDYLWLLAMLMTSPVVVTLGLSLTIPLAILADWVLGDTLPAMAMYWSGALLILASFVVVNLDVVTVRVDGWLHHAAASVRAAWTQRQRQRPETQI